MINTRVLFFTAAFAAVVLTAAQAAPFPAADSAVYSWTGGGEPPAIPEIPVKSAGYTNGIFKGRRESAYYGIVQVEAIIRGGNIIDVRFLSYPNDNGTSRYINSIAMPRLKREAVRAQGSHVRLVSGATFTSEAFHLSLHTALVKAVN